jgi:hypothetical protein
VERNHIYGVPQNAIYAARLFATSIADNYIEGFGESDKPGTWHGIFASVQGEAASTIAHNRIFNFQQETETKSSYRYVAITVNYGTGVAVVTGNAIRGKGTPRGIGLHFSADGDRKLMLTSTGNAVNDVATERYVDANVTLKAGL